MSCPEDTRTLAVPWRAGLAALLCGLALVGCGRDGGQEAAGSGPRDGAAARGAAVPAGSDAATDAVAELAPLLARAARPGLLADDERAALEAAMARVLEPAARCDGCALAVSYLDEPAGGDRFRCRIGPADGEPVAELEVYHRAALAPDAAAGWGRERVAGQPASAGAGLLFVWPGRIEIRAFARDHGPPLSELAGSLPLEGLSRL